MKQPPAHSWVEVSERALVANIRAHRRLIGPKVKLMAVVKSNAYGHGLELVGRVCQRSGQVDWLGVANLKEAAALRQGDIKLPILVLSYYRPFVATDLVWALSHRISFVVYEEEQLKALERAAKQAGKQAHVHLKLETGMARLGVMPSAAALFLKRIRRSPYLKLEGVASHLATAEARDQVFLNKQLGTYEKLIHELGSELTPDILKHIACSAAITAAPQSHYSLVRLGIALYGLWPSRENHELVEGTHKAFSLRPALIWKTQIIELQHLPKGTPVGYDRTFITQRPTVMAAIPVGYWDGYDRKLSNKGVVLIGGTRVPIIGRICMNISMVDVTDVRQRVVVGDEVILIGQQKKATVSADELARHIGTINYEVVTSINPQLPRILT